MSSIASTPGIPIDSALSAEPGVATKPVKPPANGAFFYMDAMRAILALAVAMSHAWRLLIHEYQPGDPIWMKAGFFLAGFAHSAVVLFFVLSGYWITRSVVQRAERGWSWRHYLIDRLSRLWVVIIPAVAIGGLLDAIGVYVLKTPTHLGLTETFVLHKNVGEDLSPALMLANLSFFQFNSHTFGTNAPLWSVSYEFWYYIWFPALWLALRYRRYSLALLTFGLALYTPLLAFSFLTWLCGSVLFFATAKPLTRWKPTVLAATLGVSAVALIAALLWSRGKMFGVEDLALATAFTLFLYGLIRWNPGRSTLLAPVATFGAQASFSLYATHMPLMAFVAGLIAVPRRLDGTPGAGLIVLGTIAFATLCSIGFARLTEANTDRVRGYFLALDRSRRAST